MCPAIAFSVARGNIQENPQIPNFLQLNTVNVSVDANLNRAVTDIQGVQSRRGYTIRLKRLRRRASEIGGPQNFGSKDNFQDFSKQLYLSFCFGPLHVFYYAANKRSL